MSGWYAMKRGWLDHEIFQPVGQWSRAEAWVWMIENAAFHPVTIDIGGKPHAVPRGALCFSQRFLSRKFRWSQKALQTFLKHLEAHGVVKICEARTGIGTASRRTQVTLCNYEKYQDAGIKTESRQHQDSIKEEQGNKITVSSLRSETAPTADLTKLVFDAGTALLVASGMAPARAKSMLGKWRKDHGDAAVIAAIGKAQREGAINPVEYISGIFRKASPAASGEFGAFGRIREVH